MTIRFTVPGAPTGKGRHRTRIVKSKAGNTFAVAYTPAKTRTYEGIIKSLAMDAMRGEPPLQGPVMLSLLIKCAIPAGWPQWKRAAALRGHVFPTTKPDGDNVAKSLLDGGNGVLWDDDVQVVEFHVRKAYREHVGIDVEVTALVGQACQTARKDWVPFVGAMPPVPQCMPVVAP